MLKTELRQAGCRDPAEIIAHHPWSCVESYLKWDSLHPTANQLYGCVFSWCFTSTNSTGDKRNSGSGDYVENLDDILLGWKKERKKISKKGFYKDRSNKRMSKETDISMF